MSPDPTTSARFQLAAAAGLTAEQVPRLRRKWAFGFPEGSQVRGQPTVAGGRVFVGSDNGMMYALDAKTGCVHWSFEAGQAVVTPIRPHLPQRSSERSVPLHMWRTKYSSRYRMPKRWRRSRQRKQSSRNSKAEQSPKPLIGRCGIAQKRLDVLSDQALRMHQNQMVGSARSDNGTTRGSSAITRVNRRTTSPSGVQV